VETDDMLSRAVARELGVQGVAVLRGAAPFQGARLGARNFIVPGDVIKSVEGRRWRAPRNWPPSSMTTRWATSARRGVARRQTGAAPGAIARRRQLTSRPGI
jgi:hypothetical protein